MVQTGGIVTSLDPKTGLLLKQGRSPDALGEYYASPIAADGKVFLASAEGKITVFYVRTRSALYSFSASR